MKFTAPLKFPAKLEGRKPWAFVVLPKKISDQLPRRGRTTVAGTVNGESYTQTLEPDGNLSHWLRIDNALLTKLGDVPKVTVELEKLKEPEPKLPANLSKALKANGAAKTTWDATTTIARLDWIHWIESAKQATTRAKRLTDAIDMLEHGKKRVCCFDPSGHYSNSLSAPEEREA